MPLVLSIFKKSFGFCFTISSLNSLKIKGGVDYSEMCSEKFQLIIDYLM